MHEDYHCCVLHSLVLQSLELCVERLIVPLVGLEHVVLHPSEGIDEVVTETGVNVSG